MFKYLMQCYVTEKTYLTSNIIFSQKNMFFADFVCLITYISRESIWRSLSVVAQIKDKKEPYRCVCVCVCVCVRACVRACV